MRFLVVSLVLAAAAAGCGTNTVGNGRRDGSSNGGGDGGATQYDMAASGGPCDDQHPCMMGKRCYMGACIPDNGTCGSDADCQNDSYCDCTGGGGGDAGACMGGVCVPYGQGPRGLFNPDCHGSAFSSSDFKPPIVKCSWTQADVIDTPVVVDLDGDGKPEIVFSTYPDGQLVALRGATCAVYWQKQAGLNNFGQIAAADLDGDKLPEIIATNSAQKVVVFDHLGNLLATAPTSYNTGGLGSDCTGPAIVDVDGMAPPEIVVNGQTSRFVKGNGQLQILYTQPATQAQWGVMTAAADLDGDGVPEIITGRQVYDGKTGANKTPAGWAQLTGPGAYPAIADMNKDGKPDVVLVQSTSGNETVSVWDWANAKFIFGPMPVPNGWGGPPTVADFNGDGFLDFGSAGPNQYSIFSMSCWPNGGAGCVSKGILWQKPTHDISSGGTGSSVFDFNGDKKAEVIYRDECFFRVMDGTTGKTIFAQQITSGTCLENPVVADVDNDGHADVVVPSDNVQGNYCSGATDPDTNQVWNTQTKGIFVLTDPMNRWMPSRSIWNQHTYHITNVNDDSTIPTAEQPNWKSWNNYRTNVQGMVNGMAIPQTDYTGGISTSIDNGGNDCKVSERLWANVCNRGTAPAAPPVFGTFYNGDPRKGAPAICTTKTTLTLKPGDCEAVFCDWKNPPQGATDVWFRADDDGMKQNVAPECDNGNNLLLIKGVMCSVPG